MLSFLQHLSSDDFGTLSKAQEVLQSQGLPILYGGKLKPRIYQACGQHTAGCCPRVPQGTNTLYPLPLTHQSSPTPAQFVAGISGSHPSPHDPDQVWIRIHTLKTSRCAGHAVW